jgi:hypothetical protein
MVLRREWTDGLPVLDPRGFYSTSGALFRESIHDNMVNLKTAEALGLTVGPVAGLCRYQTRGPNNDNPGLDITGLPVFTLSCVSGPNAGNSYVVTDPGRALISGKCADIGKVKGPILRGLAGRAPYFHNGSAATLLDVVNFYDQRFVLGFTDEQKADLAAFLQAL